MRDRHKDGKELKEQISSRGVVLEVIMSERAQESDT